MNLPLAFRPVAQSEFDDAAGWYKGQQPGLGDNFVAEVQTVLDTIANLPEPYPIAEGVVRVVLFSRFPYCVYYRVKLDRVVILAVFHSSRDPTIWQKRK